MHSDASRVVLHLSLLTGVGPATIARLADYFKATDWSEIYTFTVRDFIGKFGLSEKQASTLRVGLADRGLLEKELYRIERYGVQWMTLYDEMYPSLLRHIYMPPSVVYWRGDLSCADDKTMAIVGARKANGYAKRSIDLFVQGLLAYDWTIVSGGALGADSMAHHATVERGGKTIAVLGSGLLQPYPLTNKRLFEQIVATGGAVVSAFPLMTQALPGNFPARNRIIAGLSTGCIVAQAAYRSGALITARYALEQGRDVFAVPGPIDDPLSEGCHELIRQGATLVADPDTLLQELGLKADEHSFQALKRIRSKNNVSQGVKIQAGEALSEPECALVRYCERPIAIDDLAGKLDLGLSIVHQKLFDLQLRGVVDQNAVGMWYRV